MLAHRPEREILVEVGEIGAVTSFEPLVSEAKSEPPTPQPNCPPRFTPEHEPVSPALAFQPGGINGAVRAWLMVI